MTDKQLQLYYSKSARYMEVDEDEKMDTLENIVADARKDAIREMRDQYIFKAVQKVSPQDAATLTTVTDVA